MSLRKISLSHPRQRSILTDMLPYEVPLTFSNSGFFRFCRKFDIAIFGSNLQWVGGDASVASMIKFLFGYDLDAKPNEEQVSLWGNLYIRYFLPASKIDSKTLPFQFRISHRDTSRVLTIIHPRNQVLIANFYAQYHTTITYQCSVSDFSLRRPRSIAKYVYFDDKLHASSLDPSRGQIEEEDKEYEQLGSFFVYRKFSNIHKFFESRLYHRLEKKFDRMLQVDISRCFDSIYSHSIDWAVLGKPQTKFSLEKIVGTFPDRFDKLMQDCNYGETNGIVIGPEFSRVFAEIILQSVDRDLENKLEKEHELVHKKHYHILRYVDDYFVFFNEAKFSALIQDCLQSCLSEYKLALNEAKSRVFEKPIVTDITISKNKLSHLLNEYIDKEAMLKSDDDLPGKKPIFVGAINSARLIVGLKTIIRETGVHYPDIMNYLLTIIERKRRLITDCYLRTEKCKDDQRRLTKCIVGLMDFVFFAYSATPRVNQSIRLCRIISDTAAFYNQHVFDRDVRHLLYKFIFDHLSHELTKNSVVAYREIETQYLLLAIKQLGRSYSISVQALARHFNIYESGGHYHCAQKLTYFSLTTLIAYIGGRNKYYALSALIEDECLAHIERSKKLGSLDTGSTLLFLDLLVCPFVSDWLKAEVGAAFGLSKDECELLQGVHDEWFIAWGDKLNVGEKLDAKRSRQVY